MPAYGLLSGDHRRLTEGVRASRGTSKSICIEAGELLECFQWSDDADSVRVESELADVLTYCLLLADRLDRSPGELVLAKLEETRAKYPVERSRGTSAKYDQLAD